MSTIAPPPDPSTRPDELEALIREARARQWRRRALSAAALAVMAGVGLSVWAAIPGDVSGASEGGGRPSAATSGRKVEATGRRIPIAAFGSSGSVTWADNGGGLWLTTNGGASWRRSMPRDVARTGDPVARVLAADFVDARHGWISVDDVFGGFRIPSRSASLRHMEIDRTTDGGRTWRASVPPGCLETCVDARLDFLDTRHGFALVDLEHGGGNLFSTRDGGATWTLVARITRQDSFTFLNERDGVATDHSAVRRTTDSGRHWARAGQIPTTFSPIAGRGRHLVVFGLRHLRLVAHTSGDGGRHWNTRLAPAWVRPGLPDNDISAPTANDWVVPASPRLFTTHDAGRTWHVVRPVDLPRGWSISQIEFTSPRAGWAIFAKGGPHVFRSVLVRTTDGGVHWTPAGPTRPKPHRH